MKRIKSLLLYALVTQSFSIALNASPISVERARLHAQEFLSLRHMPQRSHAFVPPTLMLAYEARSLSGATDYYVFNHGTRQGYVVVGADDCATPVWGYSNNGHFDADSMPDNMRSWMAEYQRQLQWLRSHSEAQPAQVLTLTSSVSPLLKTQWGQGMPYNNMCPEIPEQGVLYYGKRVCTGCVATAMSQIMKYYQWPATGMGNYNYECEVKYGTTSAPQSYTTTLSADFSKSTYRWGNMLNKVEYVYGIPVAPGGGAISQEQSDALALLFRDAGISLEMNYGTYSRGGSAAATHNAVSAMAAFFDYDPTMTYYYRDSYEGDWEQMLRNDLDKQHPIIYSGQSSNSGHAFVIDGYDDSGYFHVNWGWDGSHDGYFKSTLLNPKNSDGYNSMQQAITGIQPDYDHKSCVMLVGVRPKAESMPINSIQALLELQALGGDYSGQMSMWMMNEDGTMVTSKTFSLTIPEGESKTVAVDFSGYGTTGKSYYFAPRNPYITTRYYIWKESPAFTITEAANSPVLSSPVDGSTLDFGSTDTKHTISKSVSVKGEHLTSHLTLSIAGDNASCFRVGATTISAVDAEQGQQVSVIYVPASSGVHSAQLVVSGGGLDQPVTVNLIGQARDTEPAGMPFISSRWHQKAPFNSACMLDTVGNPSPPGCGAVALGQILNYHRTTNHGFGHAIYKNLLDSGKQWGVVDVDFDTRTYDWSNIIDAYSNNNYTQAQANAVADLLVQVGAGMRMMYRKGGSTPANDGSMLWGMHHHLHIASKSMKHYRRDYSTQQWIDMLNNELENGRPVMYGGTWVNPLTGEKVGHIFIIDAVDDQGRYRVNWGNGGAPAYVTLDAMNQISNRFPGGRTVCYQVNNHMITDLQPVLDDDYVEVGLINTIMPVVDGNPALRELHLQREQAFRISYTFACYSMSDDAIGQEFALGFYDGNKLKGVSYYNINPSGTRTSPGICTLRGGVPIAFDHYYRVPGSLPDGDYHVRFVSRLKGATTWHPTMEIAPATMHVRVENGRSTLTLPVNHQLATHLRLAAVPRVVENPLETGAGALPGTAIRLELVNPSHSNFQDTLRIDVTTTDGHTYMHKYVASAYEQCSPVYDILIPDALCDLKGKSFTTHCYYYEKMLGQYLPLDIDNHHLMTDVDGSGLVDIDDLNIIVNHMLRKSTAYAVEADVDGNDVIDIDDLNLVVNSILHKEEAMRLPFVDK